MRRYPYILVFLVLVLFANKSFAMQAEVLDFGWGANGRALFLQPVPAKAKVGIILLPGGDGKLNLSEDGKIRRLRGNQLVRTRNDYVQAGFAVMLPDADANLNRVIEHLRKVTPRVVIVATSRGTLRAAEAISAGVKPDLLVLTAGVLGPNRLWRSVPEVLQNPNVLPPTLIIHHSKDECSVTSPEVVSDFVKWSNGKAKNIWISGGENEGDPCEAAGYHGFAGRDEVVVKAITSFSRR